MNEPVRPSGAGTLWAWVPAMLLGSMLLGLGTLAHIAIDDPSFALESDYYDKAVHWDRSQQEARASEALGLRLTLLEPLSISPKGEVELAVGIHDRRNLPLEGAAVQLEAFPNAYASQIEHVTLREISPGVYGAKLSRAVAGLWELRFSVTRGLPQFRQVIRVDVTKRGAA